MGSVGSCNLLFLRLFPQADAAGGPFSLSSYRMRACSYGQRECVTVESDLTPQPRCINRKAWLVRTPLQSATNPHLVTSLSLTLVPYNRIQQEKYRFSALT